VLNIIGDEKKYGKEIGGDIIEGKRTLITIRALAMLPKKKSERLRGLLQKNAKNREDMLEALALLKESGAAQSAADTAERAVQDALRSLESLPESEARQTLSELAKYITRRER